MNTTIVILKKELKQYFSTPLAYVIAAIFTAIAGWIFFNLLVHYLTSVQNLSPEIASQVSFIEQVIIKFFGNLNFLMLFICPLISMRLFSEERKQSTMDLLNAAPISDWSLVLGKFLASSIIILFMFAMTLMIPIILYRSGLYETRIILSGYMGLYFNVLCYLSIGLFASSLTENQIVSAVMSTILIIFFWMFAWASNSIEHSYLHIIVKYLGLILHFQNIVRGIVSSVDMIYYVSFIGLFLLLTKKSLEARRW